MVKQSLPRLNVAEEWLASQERTIREANALRAAAAAIPGSVPEVLSLDEKRYVLVIEAAPPGWADVEAAVARRRGRHCNRIVAGPLARKMATSRARRQAAADSRTMKSSFSCESTPTTASRPPDTPMFVRSSIGTSLRCSLRGHASCMATTRPRTSSSAVSRAVGDRLRGRPSRRSRLRPGVHAESPVAQVAASSGGSPVNSGNAPTLSWQAIEAEAPAELIPEGRYLCGHVGCLMLARVDGKSPAEYLTEDERERARALALPSSHGAPRRLRRVLDGARRGVR